MHIDRPRAFAFAVWVCGFSSVGMTVADRLLRQRSLFTAAMPWTRWASSADSFPLTPFIAAAVVAAKPLAWNGVAATTAESGTPLPVSAL